MTSHKVEKSDVKWTAGFLIGILSLLGGVWLYMCSTYATNDRVDGIQKQIDKQDRTLERVEIKIDRLLERGH